MFGNVLGWDCMMKVLNANCDRFDELFKLIIWLLCFCLMTRAALQNIELFHKLRMLPILFPCFIHFLLRC